MKFTMIIVAILVLQFLVKLRFPANSSISVVVFVFVGSLALIIEIWDSL